MPPLVSIIVPTFNRRQLLCDTLESIYKQTYRPIEVLVVDDGSTDDTESYVTEWARKHNITNVFDVCYIRQENSGPSAARNRGISEAKGDYVQFLDSDDILLPDKIQDGISAFMSDSDLDLVYCLRGDWDPDKDEVIPWTSPMADIEADPSPAEVVLRSVSTPLPLFTKVILEKSGLWNSELKSLEDWEFIGRVCHWVRAAKCIHKIQVLSRRHSGSRLSVNSWGLYDPIKWHAKAYLSMYKLVSLDCTDKNKMACNALARRSISCVRVAAAAGHIGLAKQILTHNRACLASHYIVKREAWIWGQFLQLPFAVVKTILWPIAIFKRL